MTDLHPGDQVIYNGPRGRNSNHAVVVDVSKSGDYAAIRCRTQDGNLGRPMVVATRLLEKSSEA